MGRDWKRLAEAIKDARQALRLTQVDLASAAGVSESTIQNLEAGESRSRIPTSLPRVERALNWREGSAQAVLEGGEPTPSHDDDTDRAGTVTELPLRIVQELADGPLLDTTVLDLTPLGSDARMIVVVKGKPDASPEQIRKDLLAWAAAQRHLENLGGSEDQSPSASEA
ncbi:XRE family transcriptional regulator [Streptomyces sp. TM32]|uniref:helix-turn-helix transcriptional regulator n=1 Tax=Streptomyces sp. TM32 TaxID=1652669 RepID=UPI0010111CF6|nr:helix-turn-helix transcriptional regulator [Streptomyces sp. TM32]RXS78866.1 XRE family transcriptional regulator [Streptomyces sp. TM32]